MIDKKMIENDSIIKKTLFILGCLKFDQQILFVWSAKFFFGQQFAYFFDQQNYFFDQHD
jgi:hypothetical protein